MNDFFAPPVPVLSNDWIAAHRDHVVREIATPRRRQVSPGFALRDGGVLAAVGAATAAVLACLRNRGDRCLPIRAGRSRR